MKIHNRLFQSLTEVDLEALSSARSSIPHDDLPRTPLLGRSPLTPGYQGVVNKRRPGNASKFSFLLTAIFAGGIAAVSADVSDAGCAKDTLHGYSLHFVMTPRPSRGAGLPVHDIGAVRASLAACWLPLLFMV